MLIAPQNATIGTSAPCATSRQSGSAFTTSPSMVRPIRVRLVSRMPRSTPPSPPPLGVTLKPWPCGFHNVCKMTGSSLKLWNTPSTMVAIG